MVSNDYCLISTCIIFIGQKEGESHDELCSTALKKLKEASPLSLKITLQSVSAVFHNFLVTCDYVSCYQLWQFMTH